MLKSSLGKNITTAIGIFSIHNSRKSEKLYKSYSWFFGTLFLFLIWFYCSHMFYFRTHNYFVESLDYPVFYLVGLLGAIVFSMSIYWIYGLSINLYLWVKDRKHAEKMNGKSRAERKNGKTSKRLTAEDAEEQKENNLQRSNRAIGFTLFSIGAAFIISSNLSWLFYIGLIIWVSIFPILTIRSERIRGK